MKQWSFIATISVVVMMVVSTSTTIAMDAPLEQTIVVISTTDSGPGTLREALQRAPPSTTITFDPAVFLPDDPTTINVTTPLPELTQGQITIDASNAGVILDGSRLPREEMPYGLLITSSGNVVRGLQILHFPGDGIDILRGARDNLIGGDRMVGVGPTGQGNVVSWNGSVGVTIGDPGTSNNVVIGNYIGTDPTGSSAWGNGVHGVMLQRSANNTIGGTTPGERNVISGNGAAGVRIEYPESRNNIVIGNYIGTDASGTAPLGGNNHSGVAIEWGASGNRIGGLAEGERNIISGNSVHADGVHIRGSGTDHNLVIGNFIGLDVSGTQALPNSHGVSLWDGASHNTVQANVVSGHEENPNIILWDPGTSFNVVIGNLVGTDATGTVAIPSAGGVGIRGGASDNRIGGSAPGEGNLICGNGDGIDISYDSTRNLVIGNLIGTDITGTTAIPNGNGIRIQDAPGNTIGGSSAGEGNIIGGNVAAGVEVTGARSVDNHIIGNYIGTDSTGTEPLSNLQHGVYVLEAAGRNVIGPGNTIAFNGQGVTILGGNVASNLITQNSIYHNEGLGIQNWEGGNNELSPPTIANVGSRIILGTTMPNASVEIFSDEEDEGRKFEGSTMADEQGNFTFHMPVGRFTGPYVTATTTDSEGNTSQFSLPGSPPAPAVTRELPGIVAPTQVSVEPKVVGTNLGLALFSVLFFGLTSTVFNSIMVNYRDEMVGAFRRLIPMRLAESLGRVGLSIHSLAKKGRGRLLLLWLFVLLVTSVIESFLDTEVGILSPERLGVIITVLISAIAVNTLELVSDLYAHRRWAPTMGTESKIQWIGMAIAVVCVILSRALDFRPGYLYGIAGTIYLMPKLTDDIKSGKRATFVLMTVFVGGLILWIATVFLPGSLAELEPIFLTIFLISLQGVFFELFPLAITDGGDIWSWQKGVWFACFSIVFFCFYHFVLNPNASDVQALQQNGVQTLLILIAVFGLATLILWLLLPFRLERKRANQS